MKDVKYILNDNALYDYHRLQEKLTHMAAQGWHLEKITNLIWKFRRGEPRVVRYEIIYAASASAYNSHPTDAEEELSDLCAQAGWERVAAFAQVQVYRNEDPNATPIETDEIQKYENIRRNMGRHFIPQQIWMTVLFSIQFLMFCSSAMRSPASTLSSSATVLTIMATAAIVILYSCILFNDLLWLRRARRAVDTGLSIPPNRFYRWFRWVMWANIALYLLALLFLVEPAYGLSILVMSAVLAVTTLGTLALTKRLNAPKWVNFLAPTLVTMAIIFSSRPLLSPVLTPEETQVELPLTLSQLTGADNSERLTIGVDSSPLVTHGRYYDFGGKDQIQYTVVEIHCPLFYDMILNELEQNYIRTRRYQGDAILSDELREIIGADYLRRSNGSGHDRWFICWEDRIVDFYADWILTDEQISIVVDALRP